MKRYLRALSLSLVLFAPLPLAVAGQLGGSSNPAKDKFQDDIKASVLNGSLTIPQVKYPVDSAEQRVKLMRTKQNGDAKLTLQRSCQLDDLSLVTRIEAYQGFVQQQ